MHTWQCYFTRAHDACVNHSWQKADSCSGHGDGYYPWVSCNAWIWCCWYVQCQIITDWVCRVLEISRWKAAKLPSCIDDKHRLGSTSLVQVIHQKSSPIQCLIMKRSYGLAREDLKTVMILHTIANSTQFTEADARILLIGSLKQGDFEHSHNKEDIHIAMNSR